MFVHLVKLVWNRKRASALLVVEIFFTFLVVFLVTTLGTYLLGNLRRPLGFDHRPVWVVSMDVQQASDDEWTAAQVERFARLLRAVGALPWVEAVAGAHTVPYQIGSSQRGYEVAGRHVETEVSEVTDDFARVMGLRLVEGRWFEPADDALGWEPVVVNLALARLLYGGESPLGRPATDPDPDEPETRIVGVVDDYRRGGELAGAGNFMFERTRVDDSQTRPPRNLVLEVAPGSAGEREAELSVLLYALAPDWSFTVEPLSALRGSYFRLRLAPLVAGALVAFFLLVMVALGLTGVVWQNVTRRRREIGLRRAAGATGGQIHRQLVGELLLTAGLGLLVGSLLVLQLPALGLFAFLTWPLVATSLALALAAIVLITALAGLYPSWMASRVPPAEALRYE